MTSNSASSRLDAVSSGPNTRKLRVSVFSFMTSRSIFPRTRVASAMTRARLRNVDRIIAEIRHAQVLQQQARRWRADSRPCAACPSAPARPARESTRRDRRKALRDGSSSSTLRASSSAPAWRQAARAAPGGRGTFLRSARRRRPSDRSIPWAISRTIIGHCGRFENPFSRASF